MTLPVLNSIIDARDKRSEGMSYKLDDSGLYAMDATMPEVIDMDEGKMSMWIYFADGNRRDGVGDLININGISTERHRKNALVLWDHGKSGVALPIGMGWERDRNGKYDPNKYTVHMDPDRRQGKVNAFFYQGKGIPGQDRSKEYDHALFCEQLYHMASVKMLGAGSIGYTIIEGTELPIDYSRGIPKGVHLHRVNMLEASLTVIPANQDTVRKALCMGKVCGKPLSPMLVKSLTPYAPMKKTMLGPEGTDSLGTKRLQTPGKTQAKVPLANLPDTKIPPPKWKPGVGAIKKDDTVDNKEKKRPEEDAAELDQPLEPTPSGNPAPEQTQSAPPPAPAPSMPNEPDPMMDPTMAPGNMVQMPPEKFSAQVLRRVHEDHRLLMADYDEMLGQLEHPEIAQGMIGILQGLDAALNGLEQMWMTHHANLPPLEGARGLSNAAMQPAMPVQQDMATANADAELDAEGLPGEDAANDSNATTPADSATEELPTGDEVIEGMEKGPEDSPGAVEEKDTEDKPKKKTQEKRLDPAHHKNLREKYGKCQECGKKECHCKSGTERPQTPGSKCMKEPNVRKPGPCPGEGPSAGTAKKPEVTPAENRELHTRQGKSMVGALKSHEMSVVKEARSFLKELSTLESFEEEHRMKSYAFHKDTDRIANFTEDGEGNASAFKSLEDEDEMHKSIHPHRKMCKHLSRFFKRLSNEKAFGDAHREEAGDYYKGMEDMMGEQNTEEGAAEQEVGGDSMDSMAGEVGEKSFEFSDEDSGRIDRLSDLLMKLQSSLCSN